MAYEKQNFKTGQVLEAEHLNHMEDGIEELDKNKLDSTKLQEAINAALKQAKESGEFKGDPGETPKKGTDYFTTADKNEMVNLVLNALPTWTGGSY